MACKTINCDGVLYYQNKGVFTKAGISMQEIDKIILENEELKKLEQINVDLFAQLKKVCDENETKTEQLKRIAEIIK